MSTIPNRARLLGSLTIFGSAVFFYLSTVVIRWSDRAVDIDASYFAFARFLLGFGVTAAVMAVRRTGPRVHSYHLLVGRALSNCIAVFCFFKAVERTTVAQANILNMTYPLFVALISWLVLRKQRDVKALFTVLVAIAGIWLVLAPELSSFKADNLWGLCSGVTAAFAIVYLNVSRQYHDTNTILLFMFGIGAVTLWVVYHQRITVPNADEGLYLALCAGAGVAGQYLLTLGFRYVTAVEGSIVSSARILLAALIGPYVAFDPPLTPAGWLGALLIFGANVYLALRRVA
ncbi:MAG: EamA family transporter [Desulfatitalea sp.]|nr:DMT family transporter [Desulfatitalea sp.]NNK02150.1 EamA family transporter [Desulfatitalea sp.]